MKHILLLSTGGTIASRPGADGLEPGLSGEELIASLEDLKGRFDVQVRQIMNLDSSNIQAEEWQLMARCVYESIPDYDGIIITHGTDTMAYTASMLSFMLQGLRKPVVLTGSQLPIGHPLSDGYENLRCAFAMAGSGMLSVVGRMAVVPCSAWAFAMATMASGVPSMTLRPPPPCTCRSI